MRLSVWTRSFKGLDEATAAETEAPVGDERDSALENLVRQGYTREQLENTEYEAVRTKGTLTKNRNKARTPNPSNDRHMPDEMLA